VLSKIPLGRFGRLPVAAQAIVTAPGGLIALPRMTLVGAKGSSNTRPGEVGSQTERLRDWHIVDQPRPAEVHGGEYAGWGADGARDRRQDFGVADFEIFDDKTGLP
jgi:hypothetical protein